MAMKKSATPSIAAAGGCTCLRLRKATRGMSRIYDSFIAPSGLSGPQFSLVSSIAGSPDITISELADRLMMDATTLTRNLQPLVRQGLIEAKAQPQDRRVRTLRLTSAGLKTLQTARKLWRQAQDYATAQLGPDAALLNSILDRTLEKLRTLEQAR